MAKYNTVWAMTPLPMVSVCITIIRPDHEDWSLNHDNADNHCNTFSCLLAGLSSLDHLSTAVVFFVIISLSKVCSQPPSDYA